MNIKSQSAEDVPDEIDIALNVSYAGGSYVNADFTLALKKSVYLSIKAVKISGRVKLSFRRHPISRWSFSFYQDPDPVIELDAESRFEGKSFPQLNAMILRHFKKVIRKKYVLPNYIVRYKPFLRTKVPHDEQRKLYVHNSEVTVGVLSVQVLGCSRLPLKKKSSTHYNWTFCSLSVDAMPFSERKNNDSSMWPISEHEVVKNNERKIGLTYYEASMEGDGASRKKIIIASIDPESPVGNSLLREGDVILEINGTAVVDAKHVSKLIRGSSRRLTVMVKRPPSNLPVSEAEDLPHKIDVDTVSISGENSSEVDNEADEFVNIVALPLIEGSDLNQTKGKIEEPDSVSSVSFSDYERFESSNLDGVPSNPIIFEKTHPINENEVDFIDNFDARGSNSLNEKKTKLAKSSKSPQWKETFEFRVENEHKYLNVLVWYQYRNESGKEGNSEDQQPKNILLGYVTIPLTDIAVQCLETGDRYHQQEYVLVSTAYDKVFASRSHLGGHPGLNRTACCGDITLAFTYKPSFADESDGVPFVETKVITSEYIDEELPHFSPNDDEVVDFDVTIKRHSFVDTQFYHQTKCDFCTKKIWTKSAYQCRQCGMACHKKCLQRALKHTACYSQPADITKQDETRTELDENKSDATNSAPSFDPRSTARKIEMVGKELYSELSPKSRNRKLQSMVSNLQVEIDEENEERIRLHEMKKLSKPTSMTSRIDQQITKSEQRSESLKFLMLQYLSGLGDVEAT
ncbi:PDZ domain-containing protein 8-like isoform X2 [Xenia sp. Carnegie-2017]|nr:PDZ domain-containing protein 8-like isoform X2 [Xenia sp. Carnegie-2017]